MTEGETLSGFYRLWAAPSREELLLNLNLARPSTLPSFFTLCALWSLFISALILFVSRSRHTMTSVPGPPAGAPTVNVSTTAVSTSATTVTATGPDDIIFTLQYINDNAWPSDLELDLDLGNWPLWSRRVALLADRQGFSEWLDGSLVCPDKVTHPKANQIWMKNDRSLKAFLLSHISQRDYDNTSSLLSSHLVMEELHRVHEKQGLHAKIVLMKQATDKRFNVDTPLSKTVDEYVTLHKRIIQMGPIDPDQLLATYLINGLNDIPAFENLQSNIITSADDPAFSSKMVIRRILQQDNLSRCRAEQNPQAATALLTQNRTKSRAICAHCKRPGHLTEFCIQPGGKMAGRSIDDARTAQRLFMGKQPRTEQSSTKASTTPASANVATSETAATTVSTQTTPDSIIIGGNTYMLSSKPQPSVACLAVAQPAHIEDVDSDDGGSATPYSFHSYLAITGPVQASVDWSSYSRPTEVSDMEPYPIDSPTSRALIAHSEQLPFVLDSGASVHISPERSDFKTLRPITPHPIEGFNGSSTNATGVGDIDLCIGSGHKLHLRDVLFVPTCSTRLISVPVLTREAYNFVTFGPEDCWISDKNGKVIVRGSFSQTRSLYMLNCPSARVTRPKANLASVTTPSTVLYSRRVPDVETWHRRLGHCSNRTIVDMARGKTVRGMPIDLSLSPPKCDHCVLGKQT